MSEHQKVLFVEYCADDFLGGTLHLDGPTELAYRRICDMIYSTVDNLRDDDRVMAFATKAGPKWKSIKRDLIVIHKKIHVQDGFIRVKKCSEVITKTREKIEQASRAGKASAEKRKALKDNNTTPTDVQIPLGKNGNETSTNHLPTKESKKESPLTPHGDQPAQRGIGVSKSSEGRTTAAPPAGQPFRIEPRLADADRAKAREAAPGWDLHFLFRVYDEGVAKRGIPTHPAKAFVAWCAAYTKGKSP